jgi:D-glycero-D-manno-heptose 1,7-bisphosphate phosphatase
VFRGCPGTVLPSLADPSPLPTAFLDRDGVVNVDKGYVCTVEGFEWVPGVFEAIDRLRDSGFRIVVATNQSGIGRGLYSEQQFLELTAWMDSRIAVDAVVYCPHAPEDDCPARKPGTGMLEAVDMCLGVDKERSFLVGDKASDIEAARAFGIEGRMLETGGWSGFQL